jgi:hypothetical protein
MAALASSSYSSVGWASSSLAGAGVEKEKSTRVQLQKRGQGGGVRAAAEEKEENFLQSLGTQFFKAGGTKKETAKPDEPSGTQFFGIGTRKKKAVEEEEEPKKGTQLFNFGTQKKSGTQAGTTNGSALAVRKGTTALTESLPFGRGRRVDPKTVFVAGATGQIGARISQQLLRAGFNVRGGVPDLYVAQQLAEFSTQYGVRETQCLESHLSNTTCNPYAILLGTSWFFFLNFKVLTNSFL